MAEFIPPKFADLGKKVADLFKKKFDDKGHSFTFKNKTKAGVDVESAVAVGDAITGKTKATFKHSAVGKVVVNASTPGDLKGELTLQKLMDGLKVVVSGGHAPLKKDKKTGAMAGGWSAKVATEYAQDFFAATADVTCKPDSGLIDLSATIGFDGLSVGGMLSSTVSGEGDFDIADHNFGVQYAKDDFIACIKTSDQGDSITGSYFHNLSKEHQLGCTFLFAPTKPDSKVLTFGTEYRLDANTVVKAKFDTTNNLSTAIQHTLGSPALQLGLASSFKIDSSNTSASLTAKKFGVSCTFGDF